MFLHRSAQQSVARKKGSASEQQVSNYLQAQGLKILLSNYHCRQGEIDLIALDRGQLVFIEVKARSNDRTMPIRATISRSKQKKIIHTAQHFIANHEHYADYPMRFDFVGVNHEKQTIDWLHNAFDLQG